MSFQRGRSFFGLAIVCSMLAASVLTAEETAKSPIKVGGAIGVNLLYGSYDDDPRGEGIGKAGFELFRLNADLAHEGVTGRVEYRWYDKYSLLHTAWLGYDAGSAGTLKAGVVRVPFGPTPYGVSGSWFFDQHYYVGLADDMDLGIAWSRAFGSLTVDAGYYPESEPQTDGQSLQSSRYAYDVVKRKADRQGGADAGFEERHQFNLRAILALEGGTEAGASLQYGLLRATNAGDGGNHYAVSGHLKNVFGGFILYSQLTYYVYDIEDPTPWGTGALIPMGAFDYADLVASEGIIPALSLRYGGVDVSKVSWLDAVTPYVEWSSILKREDAFNDSTLVTVGAAWTIGALYLYSDLAFSDGNYFVGFDDAGGDFGGNEDDSWNWRLNLNFRYYF